MVIIGWIVWSIVLRKPLIPTLPIVGGAIEKPFIIFGELLGIVIICLVPGLPIFLGLKQLYKRSERFRKFVDKMA